MWVTEVELGLGHPKLLAPQLTCMLTRPRKEKFEPCFMLWPEPLPQGWGTSLWLRPWAARTKGIKSPKLCYKCLSRSPSLNFSHLSNEKKGASVWKIYIQTRPRMWVSPIKIPAFITLLFCVQSWWQLSSTWLSSSPNTMKLTVLRIKWRLGFVQSLHRVQLFMTPWNAACQAPLSFTISRSLLKLMWKATGSFKATSRTADSGQDTWQKEEV